MSVYTLRDGEKETTDPRETSNILNRQYQSVFTDDTGDIPCKRNRVIPDIPAIHFNSKGVEVQLRKLDHKNAPVPDQIPPKNIDVNSQCKDIKARGERTQLSHLERK